jgi:YHS domain-containing protein
MGLLLWIVRILGVLLLVRVLLRLLFGNRVVPSRRSGGWPGGRAPESKAGGELVRDPHCGTYVPKARAIAASVGNETAYFCSATCRDTYLARARA